MRHSNIPTSQLTPEELEERRARGRERARRYRERVAAGLVVPTRRVAPEQRPRKPTQTKGQYRGVTPTEAMTLEEYRRREAAGTLPRQQIMPRHLPLVAR